MRNSKIRTIIINIFEKDDSSAIIKAMDLDGIKYFYAKGFFKLNNKNRKNILIGSAVEIEVLPKYTLNNRYFLKKAHLINKINLEDDVNKQFLARIFSLFQKIEQVNQELFWTYSNFLNNWDRDKLAWFITFFYKKIMDANNKKLNCISCVVCNSNQRLYAFNWEEGGFFCFDHHLKNHRSNEIKLHKLKSYYSLSQKIDDYFLCTSPESNKEIFQILEIFDDTY